MPRGCESMEEISNSNCENTCHSVNDSHAYSQRYKGVVPQQNGHWGAQIYTKNQRIWLGTFKSERDAAIAYDRAFIKLSDAPRNLPWPTKTTIQEANFQSLNTMETILAIIKDGSYQSKFDEFIRLKTEKENDNDLSVQNSCGFSCRLVFEKELTPSDVGKLNRLVIPKKYAVRYFPPVPDNDKSQGSANVEVNLPFYDVQKRLWKFRYCYWKSSQSFVFTRGWNQFVKEKRLMATDKISFYFQKNPQMQNSGCWFIDTCLSTSNIGANLKLGLGTQVKYLVPKEDEEGSVEDQEMKDKVIQASNVETKGFIDTCLSTSNIGANLKLGLGTQVKYLAPKEDEEGSVEDHEMKDEVIQASNETKEFKLFGVQITART